ncbi:hypothetical protein DAEQUDRAFT_725034 [Daedalea quercina L-15889]|uniref:Uncharacterized protein n=1 Tax=Daedalea quercina L-15889 TaxID=1314783 RepID=A0A165RKG5_9APHY|nr:hypothetical protein DAEQUDRAFT_725034 [Daedalea quercina L-15889]
MCRSKSPFAFLKSSSARIRSVVGVFATMILCSFYVHDETHNDDAENMTMTRTNRITDLERAPPRIHRIGRCSANVLRQLTQTHSIIESPSAHSN